MKSCATIYSYTKISTESISIALLPRKPLVDSPKLNLRRKFELPVDSRNPGVDGRVLSAVLGVDILFLPFISDAMDAKPLQDERGVGGRVGGRGREVGSREDGRGGGLGRKYGSRKAYSDRLSRTRDSTN
jgi:hypothetical protein